MKRLLPFLFLAASMTCIADDEEVITELTVCDMRGIVASHIVATKRMMPVDRQFENFVYQLQGRGAGSRRRLSLLVEWYKTWGPTAMETWFKVTFGSYNDPKRAAESEVKACNATNNAVPEVTVPNMKSDT